MLIKDIFILLLAFQVKHFLCDFPLQGNYMLGKFKSGTEWILPLAVHAMVHAYATLVICISYVLINGGHGMTAASAVIFLAAFDFFVHFTVDRIKASPHLLGRFKPDNKYFWWALGADQMAHHLCHYTIIYFLVSRMWGF